MKFSPFLLGVLLSLCGLLADANAASLSFATHPANVRAIYLDGGEYNGAFETIYFKVTPVAPAAFVKYIGADFSRPRPAGQAFTYENRLLNADPGDIEGGFGLSIFGLRRTQQEISYTVAELSGMLSTANQPDGKLFLANVMLSRPDASIVAHVQLLRAGVLVYEATFVETLPEPSGLLLGGAGSILLACRCRRMTIPVD